MLQQLPPEIIENILSRCDILTWSNVLALQVDVLTRIVFYLVDLRSDREALRSRLGLLKGVTETSLIALTLKKSSALCIVNEGDIFNFTHTFRNVCGRVMHKVALEVVTLSGRKFKCSFGRGSISDELAQFCKDRGREGIGTHWFTHYPERQCFIIPTGIYCYATGIRLYLSSAPSNHRTSNFEFRRESVTGRYVHKTAINVVMVYEMYETRWGNLNFRLVGGYGIPLHLRQFPCHVNINDEGRVIGIHVTNNDIVMMMLNIETQPEDVRKGKVKYESLRNWGTRTNDDTTWTRYLEGYDSCAGMQIYVFEEDEEFYLRVDSVHLQSDLYLCDYTPTVVILNLTRKKVVHLWFLEVGLAGICRRQPGGIHGIVSTVTKDTFRAITCAYYTNAGARREYYHNTRDCLGKCKLCAICEPLTHSRDWWKLEGLQHRSVCLEEGLIFQYKKSLRPDAGLSTGSDWILNSVGIRDFAYKKELREKQLATCVLNNGEELLTVVSVDKRQYALVTRQDDLNGPWKNIQPATYILRRRIFEW